MHTFNHYTDLFGVATASVCLSGNRVMMIKSLNKYSTAFWVTWVLRGGSVHLLLEHSNCKTYISQFSVGTRLRFGEIFINNFTENLLLSIQVKEFWKSVKIWQIYRHEFAIFLLLGHTVYFLQLSWFITLLCTVLLEGLQQLSSSVMW